MKTTMKNRGHLNKNMRAVRKITMQLLMACLVMVFVSCEKEEIFELDQDVHEVDESVKATVQIGPRLSLLIRQKKHNAPFDWLRGNRTVILNGNFYSATRERSTSGMISKIWSSPNGSDWTLRRNNPFPIEVRAMVAHDGKIWAIGEDTRLVTRQIEMYSSRDGYSWNRVKSSLPFSYYSLENAIVFRNKIIVFESDRSANRQKIHTSSDGINWTLENANAFPDRSHGTPIVFKDTLYYLGGSGIGSGRTNEIWKSTNGRDWSLVSGATPNYLHPTEDFPLKAGHAAVVHDNKVWVTGGMPIGADEDVTKSKEVWYSGDMKNWRKYTGHVSFKPLTDATILSYKNEIVLLGGIDWTGGSGDHSRSIWSIKPKFKVYVPVEIPRERPRIPRF